MDVDRATADSDGEPYVDPSLASLKSCSDSDGDDEIDGEDEIDGVPVNVCSRLRTLVRQLALMSPDEWEIVAPLKTVFINDDISTDLFGVSLDTRPAPSDLIYRKLGVPVIMAETSVGQMGLNDALSDVQASQQLSGRLARMALGLPETDPLGVDLYCAVRGFLFESLQHCAPEGKTDSQLQPWVDVACAWMCYLIWDVPVEYTWFQCMLRLTGSLSDGLPSDASHDKCWVAIGVEMHKVRSLALFFLFVVVWRLSQKNVPCVDDDARSIIRMLIDEHFEKETGRWREFDKIEFDGQDLLTAAQPDDATVTYTNEWFEYHTSALGDLVSARLGASGSDWQPRRWLGAFTVQDREMALGRMNKHAVSSTAANAIARATKRTLYEMIVNRLLPFVPNATIESWVARAMEWFCNTVQECGDSYLVCLLILNEQLVYRDRVAPHECKPLEPLSELKLTMAQLKATVLYVGFVLFGKVLGDQHGRTTSGRSVS
jgi:hypothetical protein